MFILLALNHRHDSLITETAYRINSCFGDIDASIQYNKKLRRRNYRKLHVSKQFRSCSSDPFRLVYQKIECCASI